MGKTWEDHGRPMKSDEHLSTIIKYIQIISNIINIWQHWVSLEVAYPSQQPKKYSLPQDSQVSRWQFRASGPAAPWVGALMEGCSTSWGGTGYRIIWIHGAWWGNTGHISTLIGHYWPLIFIHCHSMSSWFILYPSHSLIFPNYILIMPF